MKGKILLFLSLGLFLFPGLTWGYQVTDIQVQDLEEKTRITIVTDCPKYESFAVSESDRLVIDLEANLLWPDSILVVNKGVVTKVWASSYQYEDGRQVARVIIGLTQTTPYRIYKRDKGLAIDISHLKEVPEVEAPERPPVLKAEAPPERIEEVSQIVENHYLKGLAYYKQSEYLKAIEEFKKVPS
ncbi:AMIN domain-containing protein, partial [bacterium]|nr:AMIN domain-containing protein [bacterium]